MEIKPDVHRPGLALWGLETEMLLWPLGHELVLIERGLRAS